MEILCRVIHWYWLASLSSHLLSLPDLRRDESDAFLWQARKVQKDDMADTIKHRSATAGVHNIRKRIDCASKPEAYSITNSTLSPWHGMHALDMRVESDLAPAWIFQTKYYCLRNYFCCFRNAQKTNTRVIVTLNQRWISIGKESVESCPKLHATNDQSGGRRSESRSSPLTCCLSSIKHSNPQS